MGIVKTYSKGQIIIPKEIREKLGITPGKVLSIKVVRDHAEIRPLPDDPIEFLTGVFEDHPVSMAAELLNDRKKDNEIDEKNSL
jgi:AbrB family looped-hinge helix DNA binding protein